MEHFGILPHIILRFAEGVRNAVVVAMCGCAP